MYRPTADAIKNAIWNEDTDYKQFTILRESLATWLQSNGYKEFNLLAFGLYHKERADNDPVLEFPDYYNTIPAFRTFVRKELRRLGIKVKGLPK